MQEAIGSDVMMVLDICVPSTAGEAEIRAAMERTHRWALRSLAARTNGEQALFAIVQGGLSAALRAESAGFLTQHPFDGFAIGGLAVGDTRAERFDVVGDGRRRLLPGQAALPDGRGHAARPARGHRPRRRHVRLHHPHHAGLAGDRLHRHRPRPAHPRRAPALRRAARPGLRLPHLHGATAAATCTTS